MPQSILVGNHLFFAREGDTIDTVVVSRTAKPDNAPTTNWTSIGLVSSASVEQTRSDIEIFRPSPGRMVLHDVLESKQDLSISCTVEEASPLMWELLFGSLEIDPTAATNPGAFVPLARTGKVKGWFKFQQYNQADQLVSVVDIYGYAEIDGAVEFGDQSAVVSFSLKIRRLKSDLESGQLTNLT
jgi:hypothetical protein